MKSFSDLTSQIDENAIPQEHVNRRVHIDDRKLHERGGASKYGEYAIGGVTFGSTSIPSNLIADRSYRSDQKIGSSPFVARVENSLTEIRDGHVTNATLVKFNLKTGFMWLAEDENEDGSIKWGRGFKFKALFLNNLRRVVDMGWVI